MTAFYPLPKLLLCLLFVFVTMLSVAQSAPVNDECSGAVTLVPATDNSCSNLYTGSIGYATQSMASCVASGYPARDIWFTFTASAPTHRVTINPVSYNNYVFQVFSGGCGNLTAIACVNTGQSNEADVTLLTNLTVGNVYYLRLYDYYGGASTSNTFTICINSATTLIDNDECTGALNVTPSPDQNPGSPTVGNGYGATQSLPGCAGSAEDDIWFRFTATGTRHQITASSENSIYPILEVYNGNCSSLTRLQCRDGNSSSYVDADLTSLIPGTTYYYRVYGKAGNNVRTKIYTYVSTPPSPPANDECSGAIGLTVNTGSNCTTVYSGNTGYATQTFPSCVTTGYDARDVWFKFTAVATSQKITVTPLSYVNYVFQVYSGTCGNLTSIACVNTGSSNEPDLVLLNNLVVGQTYFFRVYDYYGGGSNTRQFSICITTTATPVANDDCSGATTITPSADSSSNGYVTANNTGATQSMAGCYGTAEDDVWFKFTATANRHRIWVNTNEYMNPVLQVFSGSCGALTSLSCRYYAGSSQSDFVDADLTNLTPGTTYYYRVYGAAANNIRTDIYTWVTTPPAPRPFDECSGAITLTVATDNGCSGIYGGNLGYATQSLPSCATPYYDAKDVWFKFTAVASTQRITVTPVSFEDYAFEVFGGACGSLTSLGCTNNGDLGDPDVALLTGLVAGNTYYIRLYDLYGSGSSTRTYTICVNSATQYVNNDDCGGALVVTPSANANAGPSTTAHNIGSTSSMPACYGTAEDDVWFKFVATSNRHQIIVGTNDLMSPVLEAFSGSCGALTSLACRYTPTGSSYDYIDADLTSLVPGNTYYYRVYGASNNNVRTSISTNIRTYQTTLPVSLVDLRLIKKEGRYKVIWQTASESYNKGFVVQYSRNGFDFDSLSFVPSRALAGNSSQPVSYEFMQSTPNLSSGAVYYRLKQVDLNGAFRYSSVVSAQLTGDSFILYPNPVKDFLFVNDNSGQEIRFRLTDGNGRLLNEGKTVLRKIDLHTLKPGVYVLALRTEGSFYVSKIVKE